MEQKELIIKHLIELNQDLANQDIDNPYIIDYKYELIDELTQDLVKHHGYKDEQAVRDKISDFFQIEQNRQYELEIENQKREAEIFKQEQIRDIHKSDVKIHNKKRRGLKM